ncbi:tyrosine-type recombinase/integrase [Staphylococcus felis]|uniref:tyrosine-type recombinase/integrase n=1 Tax=Staphylococcus felis TaxID=46127 RepID=UPI000E25F5E7|nr:site-specific integrase [Staphylococcus felis]REI31493.1 site-specific integrase [Staphylococcus felis]
MVVVKRNGKWAYDFRYNKKRYRKTGFNTRKEATKAYNEAYDKATNKLTVNQNQSFIDYFEEWIKINKENRVTQSTLNRYNNAKNVFEEKFGLIPINEVSQLKYREMLKEYSEGKYVGGRKQGRTKDSVRKLNNCFSQAFKDALNDGLISKDPTWNAPIYEYKPPKKEELKFMTHDDLKKLKEYSKSSNQASYLLIFILLVTGGRFGEVQRLTFKDIDYKKNTIHLPGTKTKSSDRTVTVAPQDIKYIQSVLNSKVRNINDKYIFKTGIGLITHNAVTKTFQRFLLQNSLGNYTLHSIRHTHASTLLANGLTIQYVSKRLGHSNIEITWRVYSHLLDDYKEAEDEKVTKALSEL